MESDICELFFCVIKKAKLKNLVEHPNGEGSRHNSLKIGQPNSYPPNGSDALQIMTGRPARCS